MMLEESTMVDVSQDIQSLTMFKRNSAGMMKRMKKTGRPLVLTVKGKAEAVVMDACVYQDLARPVDEVFDELEREA
jgi:prevent-host-death family protein